MRASIEGHENIQAVSNGGGVKIDNHAAPIGPVDMYQSCDYYHRLLVKKFNTIMGIGAAVLAASLMLNFLTLYSLERHSEKSQVAFEFFKERDVPEAELIHDAVTQILVAVNSATLTHQDKAFINESIRYVIDHTNAQTAHWHQYFSGRDKLAEERRASNKGFMDRSEKTLTSLDNRLTLLENGGGVSRR